MDKILINSKKQLIKAIKDIVIPILRAEGFTGTFPHYIKIDNSMLFFVSFQFGRSSLVGKFIVELRSIERDKLPDWAKKIPEKKLNYGAGRYGHRLGSETKGEDGIWFDFKNVPHEEGFINVANTVKNLFEEQYPLYLSGKWK